MNVRLKYPFMETKLLERGRNCRRHRNEVLLKWGVGDTFRHNCNQDRNGVIVGVNL